MKLWILFCLSTSVLGCGIRHLDDVPSRAKRMIIGGDNVTTPLKWPWQVYIQEEKEDGIHTAACGGTIINELWILTAAHCVKREDPSKLTIVAGITQSIDWNKGSLLKVADVKRHPGYTPFNFDIALLKLETTLTFTESIASVCLPSQSQLIPSGGKAVATGFGAMNVTKRNDVYVVVRDGQLRETIVPVVSPDVCRAGWGGDLPLNVVCASSKTHGPHAGDSGGPLVMKDDKGQWFQIGIASYIETGELTQGGIDGENVAKVWTDIRPYCPWIKEKTNGEVHCQDEEVTLVNAGKDDVKSGSEEDGTEEKPEATTKPEVTGEPVITAEPNTKQPEVTKETETESTEPVPETTPEQGTETTDEPESETDSTDEPEETEEPTTEPENTVIIDVR